MFVSCNLLFLLKRKSLFTFFCCSPKFIRYAGVQICSDLIRVFPGEYQVEITIKWFPSLFLLLLLLLTCFSDGSGPDITGSSHVSVAQPQKAPADHSSRQGGVGHRGRSYQRAAECEGQKSWCIQAHHTVTRHSSAQGPSEQATLTLNRLLMSRPAQRLSSKTYNLYEKRKKRKPLRARINTQSA